MSTPVVSLPVPNPKKKKQVIGGVVGVAAFLILGIIFSYNGLVNKETRVDQASADLEVQLQRRFDLIPNLVSAVQGALTQERDILNNLADARSRYAGASGGAAKLQAAGEVESALGRLLVVVENYPELASLQNIRDLQVQLEGTENRVGQARRDYNEYATTFNRAIRSFPRSIVAGLFGFEKRVLFVAAEGSNTAPTVDLSPATTAP